jgi:uncharacterized membrane protein YccC
MRNNMWRLMVWAILAAGAVVSPASAGGPTKAATGKTAAPAKGTNSANSTLVTTLHQAKTLLDTAIHDYDGHRGKAVAELHHAIHELSGATNHKANGAAKNNKAAAGAKQTTTPGETQAQSDAQLAQAVKLLEGLSGQVTNAKAATHVQTAITELNAALKIK